MACQIEAPPNDNPLNPKDFLTRLMGSIVTVEIIDGRKFVGLLLCTDRDANIVMRNALEYPPPGTAIKDDLTRRLFLITIRGVHIKRMFADKSLVSS